MRRLAVLVALLATGCTVQTAAPPPATPTAAASGAATPSAAPTPTPSPTPIQAALDVDTATPLILVHDPHDFGQLDGVAWDGRTGRLATLPRSDQLFAPNPAGTLLGYADAVYDRTGAPVATFPVQTKGFPGDWSDDGRVLCAMVPLDARDAAAVPTTLMIGAPGQPARRVVEVGDRPQQAWIAAHYCSPAADRALVVRSGGQGIGTWAFYLVRLSTGTVLWTKSYRDSPNPVDIVASHDAGYIAEVEWGRDIPGRTTIYDAFARWQGRVDGRVLRFSWDGTLALVASNQDGAPSIVDWRSGAAVWRAPAGSTLWTSYAEPGGGSLAVCLKAGNPQAHGFQPCDLHVIAADGHEVAAVEGVYP